MKLICAFFLAMTFASITNAASVQMCKKFQTLGLRSDCIKAVRGNRYATNMTLSLCTTFSRIGIQQACLEAVQYTPGVTAEEVYDCHSFNTIGGQEECLRSLCYDRGFFGGCQ